MGLSSVHRVKVRWGKAKGAARLSSTPPHYPAFYAEKTALMAYYCLARLTSLWASLQVLLWRTTHIAHTHTHTDVKQYKRTRSTPSLIFHVRAIIEILHCCDTFLSVIVAENHFFHFPAPRSFKQKIPVYLLLWSQTYVDSWTMWADVLWDRLLTPIIDTWVIGLLNAISLSS